MTDSASRRGHDPCTGYAEPDADLWREFSGSGRSSLWLTLLLDEDMFLEPTMLSQMLTSGGSSLEAAEVAYG
jgi:hypothetical protein